MFKHILVAVDGSTYSEGTIPTAIQIAKKFGSDILVLHVHEHDRGRNVVYSSESPADATRLVGKAVKVIRDAGLDAQGKVLDLAPGHVAKAIIDTAGANRIDLIVMGSRGLSDIEGLLLGSVTHKVIQLATVPVLIDRASAIRQTSAEVEPKGALTPALAVG